MIVRMLIRRSPQVSTVPARFARRCGIYRRFGLQLPKEYGDSVLGKFHLVNGKNASSLVCILI